jgi:hypothetical protein
MKYLLALTLVFLSINSWAQDDQIVVDGGVGVFHSADKGLSETKMLTIGIQEDLWGPLKMRGVTGGWIDVSSPYKSSSALLSGQVGFEVNSNGLVGGIFSGPTLISNTDQLLGGHFQFMDDLHLGIQDCHSSYIGVFYRHLSSAGLETPNIGRDVIGVEIRF